MPDRVEVYDITCPASTPLTAPQETHLFDGGLFDVRKVTIVTPPGHAGLTGIGLAYGHNVVIPRNPGAYISGDGEVIPYDLTNYPPGVGWSAFTVNLDTQAHTWEVRFEFDELRTQSATANVTPLSAADIQNAAISLIGSG